MANKDLLKSIALARQRAFFTYIYLYSPYTCKDYKSFCIGAGITILHGILTAIYLLPGRIFLLYIRHKSVIFFITYTSMVNGSFLYRSVTLFSIFFSATELIFLHYSKNVKTNPWQILLLIYKLRAVLVLVAYIYSYTWTLPVYCYGTRVLSTGTDVECTKSAWNGQRTSALQVSFYTAR